MRAGAWSTNRDLVAARLSWERARRIADALPDDDPDQLSMRIAPRTMLCATDWQAREVQESQGRFAELRELCSAAGDKVSLAIGMSGPATELIYAGRVREGSRLASEQMALLESIGDPTLTMGLAAIAFVNWLCDGEFGEILRWSQTVIDLAAGDPTKGASFGCGSPLAIALAYRGIARWWLGRPGWRQDLHDALAMARHSNPETRSGAIAWTYGLALQYGVLRADDSAVRAIEEALQIAAKRQQRSRSGLGRIHVGCRAAESGRRGRPSPRAGIDDADPRHMAAQACPLPHPGHRRVDRPGNGQGRRPRCCHTGDAPSRRRAAPGRKPLLWRLGHRRSGGDAAGAWRPGRRGRSSRRRSTDWRTCGQTTVRQCATSRCCGCARCWPGPVATMLPTGTWLSRYRAMAESLGFEGHIAWAEGYDE